MRERPRLDAVLLGALLVAVPALTVAVATSASGAIVAVAVTGLLIVALSPPWVPIFAALVLVLAEPAIQDVAGIPSAVTKSGVIALAGVLVLRLGLAPARAGVVLFFAAWTLALVWSALSPDPYALGLQGMVVAWLGFLAGWTFLGPRLDPETARRALFALLAGPAVVVVLGFLLWPVTGRTPVVPDTSGLFRVQGLSIPPHLAMAAFVAIAAGIYAVRAGVLRRGNLWLLLNTAIAATTLSRGALAGIAVLLLFALVLRPSPARRRTAKYLTVVFLAVVGAVAAVGAIRRNVGDAYQGSFNTSGRLQAWEFFMAVGDRHPWAGSGLGASSVANAIETPLGVQSGFIAPHNEFIHLYVDVGWAVAAVVLITLGLLLFGSARRAVDRRYAIGLLLGFTVLAFLDNPLSTPSIPLMLALLLNVSRAPKGGERHEHETPRDELSRVR